MRNFLEFMALLATMTQMGQIIINTDDSNLIHQFNEDQQSIPGRFQQQNLTAVLNWRDVDRRNKLLSTCQSNTIIDVDNNSSSFQEVLSQLSSNDKLSNVHVFKFYPNDTDCTSTIQKSATIDAKDFVKVIFACYETNSSESLMLFDSSNQRTFPAKKTASLLDLRKLTGSNCRSSCANTQFSRQFLIEKSKVIEQSSTVDLCTNFTTKEIFEYRIGQIVYETIAATRMLNCTLSYGDESGHLFCGYRRKYIFSLIWFVPFVLFSLSYLAFCNRDQTTAINWHIISTSNIVSLAVKLLWETTPSSYPLDLMIGETIMVVTWLPLFKILVKPRQSTALVSIFCLLEMISEIGFKKYYEKDAIQVFILQQGFLIILFIWLGNLKIEKNSSKNLWKVFVISQLWTLVIEFCYSFVLEIMQLRFDEMESLFAALLSRYIVFTLIMYFYKPSD